MIAAVGPPRPARAWRLHYRAEWLQTDLVAGLTLATYLLPAGIGDASLAGLPPQAGLYACVFSGLVFWLFCSSRHTVITVTSALSLLTGVAVAEMSAGDPARHAALAACLALMIGAIAVVAWAVRAGNAISFFSETVLVGFKAGLALYLASTQLPKLFGFKAAQGDFWERSGYFLTHLGDTHPPAITLGITALAVLLAGRRWLRRWPVAFMVVTGGIAAAARLDLQARGVALLGEIPQGMPAIGLPEVSRSDLNALMPVALAAFVLAVVETSAIGRMFAQKHGYRFHPNQELVAVGLSNVCAGLGRGFPVSGGMSQSLVNDSAGAQTPASGLIAALFTLVVVLFASNLLRNLPQPVVAAVVLAAVIGLIDLHALKAIWRFNRAEFAVAMTALVGVLGSGPTNGVLIGAGISIVLLLRQAARPHVTELGRIGGSRYFADRTRHPENQRTPGVLIVRAEASLVYFNADYVRDRLLSLTRSHPDPVRLVIFVLSTVPRIDLAGAELLVKLQETLTARGIAFRLADAHGHVRDALRRIGFEQFVGAHESHRSVDDVLAQWKAAAPRPVAVTLRP